MARTPHLILAGLLLALPTAALAVDDNDLMQEVDEDIFSSGEDAAEEDWELSGPAGDDDFEGEPEGDLDGDPMDDMPDMPDMGPVGDDNAPAGDLAGIDVGDDPPGDFVGLPEDEPPPVAPTTSASSEPEEDFGIDLSEDPPDDLAAISPPSGGGDSFDDFEDPPEDSGGGARTARKPTGAAAVLDTAGKTPLAGSFNAAVVSLDIDSVTVELPVLIARSAGSWEDGEYWLVAEFSVQGDKVGEARHFISKAGLADMAPTVAWIKTQVPVQNTQGDVKVSVSQVKEGAGSTALFTKSVGYKL